MKLTYFDDFRLGVVKVRGIGGGAAGHFISLGAVEYRRGDRGHRDDALGAGMGQRGEAGEQNNGSL